MLNYSSIKSILSEQGLTFEVAELLLRADFDKGELFWKPRSKDLFQTSRAFGTWNSRYANKAAFTAYRCGYRHGAVFGNLYQAHRTLWLLKHKQFPEFEIDHINQDKSDNRICNLREVSHLANSKNYPLSSRNKSGFNGVYQRRDTGKWAAEIYVAGEKFSLGCFDLIGDAIAARKSANIRHGFHENHGAVPCR